MIGVLAFEAKPLLVPWWWCGDAERKRGIWASFSRNSVHPTTSYSSTPGISAIAWVDAESMILHRLIISWACNHLIKLRRTQGNGTLSHTLCNVRDYWVSGILASSWFYCISTSWKNDIPILDSSMRLMTFAIRQTQEPKTAKRGHWEAGLQHVDSKVVRCWQSTPPRRRAGRDQAERISGS